MYTKLLTKKLVYGTLALALQGCLPPLLPPEALIDKDADIEIAMEEGGSEKDLADKSEIYTKVNEEVFKDEELFKDEQSGFDTVLETIVEVQENEVLQLNELDAIVSKIKPYVKDANCIALFHFDASTPFEDSCNGLKLNNYNTSEVVSLKEFGKARMFDGKAYLELPDTDLLKVKSGLTLEVIVKPQLSSQSYDGKYGSIITKEDFYEGYFLKVEEGKVTGGAMLSDGKIHTVSSGYVLPMDTFTHLAFTYGGAKMKLYVERKLVAEELAQGTIVYKTNKSVFMGLNAYENGFKGAIDEVRISDVAMEF